MGLGERPERCAAQGDDSVIKEINKREQNLPNRKGINFIFALKESQVVAHHYSSEVSIYFILLFKSL